MKVQKYFHQNSYSRLIISYKNAKIYYQDRKNDNVAMMQNGNLNTQKNR
jgi:hypothetical protein